MLLQDVRLLDKLQVISENTGSGKCMKVRGIFQRADEANSNGRIYPKKVLENAINNLIEAVQERRCVGELDHPTYDMVKLSNASHIITKLWFEGNEVYGEAEILSTPAGKVVESLIKDGIRIGVSSRGMGTLSEGKGHKIVNEDFKLLTFDIVADPSTRGAFPSLAESKNHQAKIVENTIKKVVGRNVFLSILEAKIDNKLDELRVDEKRCWQGYEPTPGVEPYAKGSCRLKRKKRKDEASVLETKADKELPEGDIEDGPLLNDPRRKPGERGEARIDRKVKELSDPTKDPQAEAAFLDPLVRSQRRHWHLSRRGVKQPKPVSETKADKELPEGEPWSAEDQKNYGVKGRKPGARAVARTDRLAGQFDGGDPITRARIYSDVAGLRLLQHRNRRGVKTGPNPPKPPKPENSSNMYEKFAGKFIQEMKSCGYGKAAKKKGGKK